jgi:hypothetical protein
VRCLRVRERILAAEMIGAGDLAGLMLEVVPEMRVLSEGEAGASAATNDDAAEAIAPDGTTAADGGDRTADQESAGAHRSCARQPGFPGLFRSAAGARSSAQADSANRGASGPVFAPEARELYIKTRMNALLEHSYSQTYVNSERTLQHATRCLSDLARRASGSSQALYAMRDDGQLAEPALCREFDELLEHPGIERIEAKKARFHVTTVPVVLRSRKGSRHLIGQFHIEIVPGSELKVRNVGKAPAGVRDGCDHPHIRAGGCCLGNIQQMVNRLLLSNDIRGLVHLSVEFVFSLNESSTYVPVTEWPPVDADGRLETADGQTRD